MEEVTAADREANDLIVRRLAAEFPDDGILAEESVDTDERLNKERVWLIDPMDGTKNFVQRDGDFAVQIGSGGRLAKPSLASSINPCATVCIARCAAKARGARRTGNKLSECMFLIETDPAEMVLASSRSHRSPRMERVVDSFGFKFETRRGSVGVKIGLIAEQEADLYLHLSPSTKQWDTCATGNRADGSRWTTYGSVRQTSSLQRAAHRQPQRSRRHEQRRARDW